MSQAEGGLITECIIFVVVYRQMSPSLGSGVYKQKFAVFARIRILDILQDAHLHLPVQLRVLFLFLLNLYL